MDDDRQLVSAVMTTTGQLLIRQPDGSYRPAPTSETDWARLDSMGQAELAETIASDPDDPGNDPGFWDAVPVDRGNKSRVTIRLDQAIVEYFKAEGAGYQSRINQVLRQHMYRARIRALVARARHTKRKRRTAPDSPEVSAGGARYMKHKHQTAPDAPEVKVNRPPRPSGR